MSKTKVNLSQAVKSDLKKLDPRIAKSFTKWIEKVEEYGIREVRKISGYNDEKLDGKLKGQNSARLSKGYRVYYREVNGVLEVEVLGVDKHKYGK